jgi:hypothetical protein
LDPEKKNITQTYVIITLTNEITMEMIPIFNLTKMMIIMSKCLPARRPVLRGNALYVLPGGAKIQNKSMYGTGNF